jgi:hypothetical protein
MPQAKHRSGRIAHLIVALAAALVLSGCTSVSIPMGPGPPPMMSAKKTRTLGAAPVKGEEVRFTFATVTGVPAEMRFTLEDSLKKYAATRTLTIVPPGDTTAVYQVKGYLSAIGDDTGTLLVYTWDVSDAFGTPLYRISGQETGAGSSTDPWIGISKAEIDAAARDTIDKLADWVNG